MKKALLIALALLLLASAFTACGDTVATETQTPTTDPVPPPASIPDESGDDPDETAFIPNLRFIVTSDTHISSTTSTTATHFKNAVEQITVYANDSTRNDGYAGLDAVAIAGDITNNGTLAEFEAAKSVFDSALPEGTELVISMGNHDYGNGMQNGERYREEAIAKSFRTDFESVFGVGAAQDTVIGGYHFITVDNLGKSPDNSRYGHDYSEESVAWVERTLASANTDPHKPIFVFQHIGNYQTVVGTGADTYGSNSSEALTEVESQYSNLFVFSGHTHFQINDECSIYQKDYTAINTGALSGTAKTTNGGKDQGIQPSSTPAPNAVYLVEADAYGRVRIRMWSIDKNDFFSEEWRIDSYDKDEFLYTADRFDSEDLFFAEDATITATSVTATSITASFLPVPEESLTARAYEVTVTDGQGMEVARKYIALPYYTEDFTTPATVTVDGLTPETAYTLSVRAVNPLYNMDVITEGTLRSTPLTLAFTTPEAPASAVKEIVGFTIGTDSLVPSSGSMLTRDASVGNPTFSYDETIGMNVISFTETETANPIRFIYKGNAEVTAALKEAFTLETYIRVDSKPSTAAGDSLIGAQHNGGFRLSIESSGKIYFSVLPTDGASNVLLSSACAVGTYYHIAVTYTGTEVTMYVNGTSVGTASISGLKLPSAESYYKIYLGADVNGSGVAEAHSNCTIAHFSMLPEALSADEIAERAAKFPSRQ